LRTGRALDSNQLTGTIPPQLGNLTQLINLYYRIRFPTFPITTISDLQLIPLSIDVYCNWLIVVVARDLSVNQLINTVPPELGNLSLLSYLYAKNRLLI